MGLTAKRFSVVEANRYPYILSHMFSISMNEMQRWLRNCDRLRLDPDASNKSWISSKYDIEGMHWTELQQIYIPELKMCFSPVLYILNVNNYNIMPTLLEPYARDVSL